MDQPDLPRADAPVTAALSRRTFMISGAATAAVPLVAGTATSAQAQPATGSGSRAPAQPLAAAAPQAALQAHGGTRSAITVNLNVNGASHSLRLDPRTALLDALREHIGLAGTKKGCDHGQCGACTVLVAGERVLSCLTLAAQVDGIAITTIEGLAAPGTLHPMQQAFIDNDAFQCGYCTPGQIISAVACVNEGRARSDSEIREYMSGNLCRCAAYPNIVAAVRQAAPLMRSA